MAKVDYPVVMNPSAFRHPCEYVIKKGPKTGQRCPEECKDISYMREGHYFCKQHLNRLHTPPKSKLSAPVKDNGFVFNQLQSNMEQSGAGVVISNPIPPSDNQLSEVKDVIQASEGGVQVEALRPENQQEKPVITQNQEGVEVIQLPPPPDSQQNHAEREERPKQAPSKEPFTTHSENEEQLLSELNALYIRFPFLKRKLPEKECEGLPLDEWKKMAVKAIRDYGTTKLLMIGLDKTTLAVEYLTCWKGVPLQGYNQNVMSTDGLEDIVNEVREENMEFFDQLTPTWKLVAVLSFAGMTTISGNMEKFKSDPNNPPSRKPLHAE